MKQVFLAFVLLIGIAHASGAEMATPAPSPQEILTDMARVFETKQIKTRPMAIQFDVEPGPEPIFVQLDGTGKAAVSARRESKPTFICKTDYETLKQIYRGELNALTAGAKANWNNSAPLDIRLPEGEKLTPDLMKDILVVGQRFLNRSSPEMIRFGLEHSRVVHGGHVTSLFYDQGFRSGWYTLRRGERLNEAADQNPFPQALIILGGKGRATFGGSTVNITAGEAYYIPPRSQHMLWTESDEPLSLIWIAWGPGA